VNWECSPANGPKTAVDLAFAKSMSDSHGHATDSPSAVRPWCSAAREASHSPPGRGRRLLVVGDDRRMEARHAGNRGPASAMALSESV
jgi:hypothetical protein